MGKVLRGQFGVSWYRFLVGFLRGWISAERYFRAQVPGLLLDLGKRDVAIGTKLDLALATSRIEVAEIVRLIGG